MTMEQDAQVEGGEVEKLPTTLEELQAFIDNDETRVLYLQDPERYEKHVQEAELNAGLVPQGQESPQGAPESQETPQGQPVPQSAAQPQTPTQKTVKVTINGDETIEIDPSMLGTYITGRTPGQGLVEALKGLKAKDETIEYLKRLGTESGQQVSGLKAQLDAARREKLDALKPKPVVDVEEVQEIDLSKLKNLIEDPDSILDSDARSEMLNTLGQLAQGYNQIRRQQSEVLTAAQRRELQDKESVAVNRDRAVEFKQIEELQSFEPALKTSKPFAELDADVHNWIMRISYLDNGNTEYNGKALESARKYFEQTPEGERLRNLAQTGNALPPDEIDKHSAIMHIRQMRSQYKDQFRNNIAASRGIDPGEIKEYELPELPFSYTDFYVKERRVNGDFAKELLAAKVEGIKTATAAASMPTAHEVPADYTAQPLNLANLNEKQLSQLIAKDSMQYSDEEARIVEEYYNAVQIPISGKLAERLSLIKT